MSAAITCKPEIQTRKAAKRTAATFVRLNILLPLGPLTWSRNIALFVGEDKWTVGRGKGVTLTSQ